MPVIAQRAFVLAPTTDTYLRLSNEEFTRQIDLTGFGNSWNTLRISVHCAMSDGAATVSNIQFFIGLCSGTAFPFGSNQCLHACGYIFGGATSTWTYNAGTGSYYATGGHYGVRRVGVTELTDNAGVAGHNIVTNGGSPQRRSIISALIQRLSATEVRMSGVTVGIGGMPSDVWYEHFLYGADQNSGMNVLNTLPVVNTQTLAPGAGWETNPLDTLDIYWSSAALPLEIYAIALNFVK